MAHPTPGEPAAGGGVMDSLLSLLNGFSHYLQARCALLGVESKEAGARLFAFGLWVFAAVILFLCAYIFLVVLLFMLVGRLFQIDAIWVALIFLVLHLVSGTIAVVVARRRLRHRFFAHTFEQFEQDRAWLNQTRENIAPKS